VGRAVLAAAVASTAACAGGRREPYLTYFDAEHAISVRYPASWTTNQAEQDGLWYRYFLGPPAGEQRRPAVSVTLFAGPLEASVDEYAASYLAGNTLLGSRDDTRQGASGKLYTFASADGATRHSLLLLKQAGDVYGLYCQGEASPFEAHAATLDEMNRSLTLERPGEYPELRNEKLGLSIRIPASWRSTRNFSGGGTYLMQYASPALAADRSRETVHAALTITVEPAPGDGSLDAYYDDKREKVGDNLALSRHRRSDGGYVDTMRSETNLAVSFVKRYYRVAGGHGYSLAFEAREDVFPRVEGWFDLIAGTLRVGPEAVGP
jgi:hypothetical protein